MAQPIPTIQPKDKRNKNFQEVSFGYPKKLAIEESRRCPQCLDPVCMKGCPLGIDIPGFIRMLREGNVSVAYTKIKDKNFFPSICGRICTAPCELACVLNDEASPIGIRALERFCADYGKMRISFKNNVHRKSIRVAVVGSGPSGLVSAVELARKGFQVTVFESLQKAGGVLRYGIPEFRIPRKVLDEAIEEIKSLGIEIKTNQFIGQTASLFDLFKDGYGAVLLALGAGVPKFMDIPGTSLGGVYYGEEFLMRLNLTRAGMFSGYKPDFFIGQKVAVIGSANTALDCARAAIRLGREVKLIFRRTEEDMLVRREDRQWAKDEGLLLEPLTKPVEIVGNRENFVSAVRCVRMDFAEDSSSSTDLRTNNPIAFNAEIAKVGTDSHSGILSRDVSNKWELIPVPDSEFTVDADTVIIAVGHQPNTMIQKSNPMLKLNDDKTIWVDGQTGLTSLENVFACGNAVTNAGPVVDAMASGKKAAHNIEKYLVK